MTTKSWKNWIVCQKVVIKPKSKKIGTKEIEIWKKNFQEKIEKTEELLEHELKHRVSNRQPIYEINKNDLNRIKENIVHLKNYSRNFLKNKYNGICETEYEIDYLGKNVARLNFPRKMNLW